MVYGAEAQLPVEAWILTSQERAFDAEENDNLMITNLNCLEEKREMAARSIVEYQKRVKAYHDARVRPQYFQVTDYVVRERKVSRPLDGGKLAQSWEGSYIVSAVVNPGTYKLETTTGKPVDRI